MSIAKSIKHKESHSDPKSDAGSVLRVTACYFIMTRRDLYFLHKIYSIIINSAAALYPKKKI